MIQLMKRNCVILILSVCNLGLMAQPNKEGVARQVDEINRLVDNAVVAKDIEKLKKHYADDFVFTHGTGLIDSKESWITNIQRMGEARFVSREHDSTTVELHGNVAIIFGKLSVVREAKQQIRRYYLHYVRVYVLRNDVWQMISHKTTKEWH